MHTVDLRAEFEAVAQQRYRFTTDRFAKNEQGAYKDKKVMCLWNGFRLYHERLDPGYTSKEARGNGVGLYIIGRAHEGGSFTFSKVPYRHKTRQLATEEMDRLVKDNNAAFAVLRVVEIRGPRKMNTCKYCGHQWEHPIGGFCPKCNRFQVQVTETITASEE